MSEALLTLARVGEFPAELQRLIDAEFHCLDAATVLADEGLRLGTRAIVTRSNYTLPRELVEALPALQVIATSGVGFDGIPVELARRRGIAVTHTPGLLDAAVCELAVGLLLALLRQIPAADRGVREGRWAAAHHALGSSLAGQRVGIVGLGRIGKGIAERLAPFGVELAYAGRRQEGVPYRHYADARSLAAQVDVLMLSCTGGASTHHLVDAGVLAALGAGFLVNVARGSVVDEAALCQALSTGALRGAALDVFEHEPLLDSPLLTLPNVVLSPHAGSATRETRRAMLRLTLDNLHAVLAGWPPLTPVPRAGG